MNKDYKNIVIEYVSSFSEEDLRWLGLRLSERLFGDLPDALDFMSKNSKMDSLLHSAVTANDLYDLVDKIKDIVTKECKRKNVALKWTSQ